MFKKSVLSLALPIVMCAPALAQNNPFDLSFGYAVSGNSGATANGWWVGGEGKLRPTVGVVGEVSGHYSGESLTFMGITTEADVSSYGFRVGPRLWIPLEDYTRVKPFADLMIGGYHSNASASVSGGGLPPVSIDTGKTGVAFGVGGGIDYRIGESVSLRAKPEWGSGLTGFALYTGLVWHLGR